jgi:hypothetical protein
MTTTNALLRAVPVLALALLAGGCALSAGPDEEEVSEDALRALPYRATLRAESGEEIRIAFDRKEVSVAGRPECRRVIASPLRIDVAPTSGRALGGASIEHDAYVRGPTVAFGRAESLSKGLVPLRAKGATFTASPKNLVIAERCSGIPLEVHQKWQVTIGDRELVDPIGGETAFWGQLDRVTR